MHYYGDRLKYESHEDTDNFINTLGSFFFHLQILQPTRITDHSATLIDNIFLNSIEHFTISGNIVYDLTDHLPNFLIIHKATSPSNKSKKFKRDYTKLDTNALLEDIRLINWEEVLSPNCDPTTMFEAFHDTISNVINKHIPIRQLSKRELKVKAKPWITPAIIKSIRVKNKLYKQFLKTNSNYYHSKYKFYRNRLNYLIKLSKRKYYSDYFLNNNEVITMK